MTVTKDDIIALEKAFWDATMRRDTEWFQEHLADESLTIASFGFADKKTAVDAVASTPVEYASFMMHNAQVLLLSPQSASISYRAVIQAAVAGHAHTIVVNVTTIHVLHEGEWKITLHQQTAAQR